MRELEVYELVILRRPAHAPAYDEETLVRLQAEHLAYRDQLRAGSPSSTRSSRPVGSSTT